MPDAVIPLVTFALFSYNQEKYIREAVAGALAQDYSPLEIIISDDGSSDGTYETILEAVASYTGPHAVSVRRTQKNRGSLLHVAEVAALAKGDFLILAAGDDISKPCRTQTLVDAFRATDAWAICSRHDRMAANGVVLEESVRAPVLDHHGFGRYFHNKDGNVQVVHGCTSAYNRRVFDYLNLDQDDYILSEDGALSVLINLLGQKIVHVDKSLVLYRESPESLTNNLGKRPLSIKDIQRDESMIGRFAFAQANRCRLFKKLDAELGHFKVRSINIDGVDAELLLQETKYAWYKMSILRRAKHIFRKTVPFAWGAPRLFGSALFYRLKWLATRI